MAENIEVAGLDIIIVHRNANVKHTHKKYS